MSDGLRHLVARAAAAGKAGGLWWGLAISAGLALASLAIAAAVVVSWAPDRFKVDAGPPTRPPGHPIARALTRVAKNVAGVVLLLLGFVMALPGVPGQGVLTMIIGLTLVDFPGKRALESRLVRRPIVLRQLDALRARFGRPPLELG